MGAAPVKIETPRSGPPEELLEAFVVYASRRQAEESAVICVVDICRLLTPVGLANLLPWLVSVSDVCVAFKDWAAGVRLVETLRAVVSNKS